MKRLFSARLVAVAVLVVALGLLAGVAWAAAPGSASSQASKTTAALTIRTDTPTKSGILLRPNIAFAGAKVDLTVTGSGLTAPGAVFVELVTDTAKPSMIIGGALVNAAGAFTVTGKALNLSTIVLDTYTVMVTSSDGVVVTTPLSIIADK